jgi:type II secretory pathway pseudopilin PulG
MRIRCGSKLECAMTLVDVTIAIAVLGIMAGGILGSFRYGLFIMQMARENQRATQIMLEKVETIRLYNWTQVNSNGFIPSTFTDVYDPQAPEGSQGAIYYGRIIGPTNVSFTSTYSTNLRQVTVAVNWTTRDVSRSNSVTTYIARDGLQLYVY